MTKRFYKDVYGCSASIEARGGKFILRVSNGCRTFHKKSYDTFSGARIAMGKLSDGWKETV